MLKDVLINNYLSFYKIDHPKFLKFCISWKRDFTFKLVYLQEFLLDLSGWGGKV